jgi:hypothetical protein
VHFSLEVFIFTHYLVPASLTLIRLLGSCLKERAASSFQAAVLHSSSSFIWVFWSGAEGFGPLEKGVV